MKKEHIPNLARTFQDALCLHVPEENVREQVCQIREAFSQPQYCYTQEDIEDFPAEFADLIEAVSPSAVGSADKGSLGIGLAQSANGASHRVQSAVGSVALPMGLG